MATATNKRPFLDFKSIRERASILAVMDRYRVQLRRVKTDQYSGKCPLPAHANAAEANSFGVHATKNVFNCFSASCRKAGNGSQGNVADFIMAMDGCNPYDAHAKLDEWFPEGTSAPHEAGRSLRERPDGRSADRVSAPPPEVNRPLAFGLKGINPRHPMIQDEHGISVETAKDWGIGYFPGKGSMAGRIVFPLYQNGELLGYTGRTTILPFTEKNPKWKMPSGFVKNFLYGLEWCEPDKPVVIVEACWEVVRFSQDGAQAAALFGTSMTPEQEKSLEPFQTIWLMLDDDDAGRAATEKIAARLRGKHNVLKGKLRE